MTKSTIRTALFAAVSILPLMACTGGGLAETHEYNNELEAEVSIDIDQTDATIAGPVWFEEAEKWLGTTEVKVDGQSNPAIEQMHNSTSNAIGRSDGTAWCASFTNWILKTTAEAYDLPDEFKGTGSAGARHFFSYLRYNAKGSDKNYSGWGEQVDVSEVAVGDIATIIWGTNNNQGHVGFVVATHLAEDGSIDGVWVLGGNQRNQEDTTEAVTVSLYELDAAHLFEFKRVSGYEPEVDHRAQAYTRKEMHEVYGGGIGKRGSLAGSR